MRLIYLGSSPHPEGIWVLITSSTSTRHAAHCLYRLVWIQWRVTQDTVADCLLVTKPPVGSGLQCITPSLGYYYSWEKTLPDVCLHILPDCRRDRGILHWHRLAKNCGGQQTESARTLEWLAYVPSRWSKRRGAGPAPRSRPSCLCMDLLRPPKVWTRHVSNYFEVGCLDISEKCFCCCCQCYIVIFLCQI